MENWKLIISTVICLSLISQKEHQSFIYIHLHYLMLSTSDYIEWHNINYIIFKTMKTLIIDTIVCENIYNSLYSVHLICLLLFPNWILSVNINNSINHFHMLVNVTHSSANILELDGVPAVPAAAAGTSDDVLMMHWCILTVSRENEQEVAQMK